MSSAYKNELDRLDALAKQLEQQAKAARDAANQLRNLEPEPEPEPKSEPEPAPAPAPVVEKVEEPVPLHQNGLVVLKTASGQQVPEKATDRRPKQDIPTEKPKEDIDVQANVIVPQPATTSPQSTLPTTSASQTPSRDMTTKAAEPRVVTMKEIRAQSSSSTPPISAYAGRIETTTGSNFERSAILRKKTATTAVPAPAPAPVVPPVPKTIVVGANSAPQIQSQLLARNTTPAVVHVARYPIDGSPSQVIDVGGGVETLARGNPNIKIVGKDQFQDAHKQVQDKKPQPQLPQIEPVVKTAIEMNDDELSSDSKKGCLFMSGDPRFGQVVMKGVNFTQDPDEEDERLEQVIVARHINYTRDETLGIPLSNMNLNYVFQGVDDRDLHFADFYKNIDPKFLPTKADIRTRGDWGDVMDQGSLGSCVAHTIAYAIRWVYEVMQKKGAIDISRLFVYYNGRLVSNFPIHEDTGLTIRSGMKSVKMYSACEEKFWPYQIRRYIHKPSEVAYESAQKYRTFTYLSVDRDLIQLKKSIKDGYPVCFGIQLYSSFMSTEVARTGIVPIPDVDKDRRVGGHAVILVGYDDGKKMFTCCNSWGPTWGDKGFFYLPYSMVESNMCSDFWTPRLFE